MQDSGSLVRDDNDHDEYAVAIIRKDSIVVYVPRKTSGGLPQIKRNRSLGN